MMAGEQALWRENAHGDIWQEPTLFDQPADDLDTPEQHQSEKGEPCSH